VQIFRARERGRDRHGGKIGGEK